MKYYDTIGFWEDDVEIKPGVHKAMITERKYAGDVLNKTQRWSGSDHQNDNLTLNIRLSIVADLYLNQHLGSIKYAMYLGTKWKVTSIDTAKYPRVIMELGEVYNGVNGSETSGTSYDFIPDMC